ncbi:MAG: T9SS type A sorting domain-containing protein [Bacteroidetes bacterium]|jgi:hypothetical protein|nr:T9SS type A sorting domain-containing protein [Bacteroidota bacterium]
MEQKQRQMANLRLVYAAGGTLVVLLAAALIFGGQLFKPSDSKAGSDSDFEASGEYWVVNDLKNAEFNSAIDVEINAKFNGILTAKIYNGQDDILVKENIELTKGLNKHQIDNLDKLPAGEYTLEIIGEDKSVTKTLVKH